MYNLEKSYGGAQLELRCLLVMNDKAFKIYSLNIQACLNIECTHAKTTSEALKLIEKDYYYEFIICQPENNSKISMKMLLDNTLNRKIKLKYICVGENPIETNDYKEMYVTYMTEPNDIRSVVKYCSDCLGVTIEDIMSVPTSEYYPIPIDFFICLDKSPSDTYIRLGKDANEQYIKRIHEGEGLGRKALDRYISKGVKFLYIKSELRVKFIQEISKNLLVILDDQTQTELEVAKAIDKIQKVVAYNIDLLQVSEELIKLSNGAAASIISQCEKNSKMHRLVNLMLKSKLSFRYKHSQVTAYVALSILSQMSWANSEHRSTLSYTSFFHDIILSTDAMCLVHNSKDLEQGNFSAIEKEIIEKHAQLSAELIRKVPHVPAGVYSIITQHHGSLNGVGFTNVVPESLSPLVTLFMIAEKVAHIVLKSETKELLKKNIINQVKDSFPTKCFEKMLIAFEESIN